METETKETEVKKYIDITQLPVAPEKPQLEIELEFQQGNLAEMLKNVKIPIIEIEKEYRLRLHENIEYWPTDFDSPELEWSYNPLLPSTVNNNAVGMFELHMVGLCSPTRSLNLTRRFQR